MPDTFFRNEKEAKKHEIIVPNVYVRIYPNGDILYSIRYTIDIIEHQTLQCTLGTSGGSGRQEMLDLTPS